MFYTKIAPSQCKGTELFKCNYDYNLLDLDNHLLATRQDIAKVTPKINQRGL